MITSKGKSVEEAIQLGLNELRLTQDQVEVKIIQEASSGFLGIGKKTAIVEITKAIVNTEVSKEEFEPAIDMDEVASDVSKYLKSVITDMGFDPIMDLTLKPNKEIYIDIVVKDSSRLIGRHGKTLNAIQGLGQTFINRKGVKKVILTLDCANYRSKRKDALEQLAEKTARDAIAKGKPVYLNPMPFYERTQIQESLKDNQHVTTYSTGKEPHRVIVIAPR